MGKQVQFTCYKCYRDNRIIDVSYYSPSVDKVFKPLTYQSGMEWPLIELPSRECFNHTIKFDRTVSENLIFHSGHYSLDDSPLIAVCRHCFDKGDITEIPEEIFYGSYNTFVVAGSKGVGKTELFTLMTDDIQRYGHKYFEGKSVTFVEDTEERKNRKDRIIELSRYGQLPGTASDEQTSIIFKIRDGVKADEVYSIYDAAGERFDDYSSDTLASHQYLKHAKGILLLVDVLQLPSIRMKVSDDKIEEFTTAQEQDIVSIVSNVTRLIRSTRNISLRAKIDVPVAVVLTKIDTVLDVFPTVLDEKFKKLGWTKDQHQERIEQVSQTIERFLDDMGEGAFLAQLKTNYSDVKYFAVASRGLDFEIDEEIEPFLVELPLIWLMQDRHKGALSKLKKWLGGQ